MIGLAIGYLLCLAISATAVGRAHMAVKFHKNDTPIKRERILERNQRHLAYVAHEGRGAPRRRHARALAWTRHELRRLEQQLLLQLPPRAAICAVFQPCDKALSVVACETGGTFWPGATNGQYWGLFQMGEYARSTYGHSWNAYLQAVYAHRYYEDAGWGPLECA